MGSQGGIHGWNTWNGIESQVGWVGICVLTLHWSHTSHLKHQPTHHLIVKLSFLASLRDIIPKDFVLVVLIEQIQHNGTRFKNAQIAVLESGDSSVGVDVDKPWFLLLVLKHVDGNGIVFQAELLENGCGFEAIGCASRVESQGIEWGA